jgi:hypothetical protein
MRKTLPFAACFLLAACSGGGAGDSRIVQLPPNLPVAETINGTPVPQELVDAFVRVKAPKADMSNPEQRAEILRVLSDYVLLAEQAQRDKMAADPKFAANVEVARLGALANEAMIRLQQQTPISDEALKAEYDAKVARKGKFEYDFGNLLFASDKEDDALKAIQGVLAYPRGSAAGAARTGDRADESGRLLARAGQDPVWLARLPSRCAESDRASGIRQGQR